MFSDAIIFLLIIFHISVFFYSFQKKHRSALKDVTLAEAVKHGSFSEFAFFNKVSFTYPKYLFALGTKLSFSFALVYRRILNVDTVLLEFCKHFLVGL